MSESFEKSNVPKQTLEAFVASYGDKSVEVVTVDRENLQLQLDSILSAGDSSDSILDLMSTTFEDEVEIEFDKVDLQNKIDALNSLILEKMAEREEETEEEFA